MDEMDEFQIVPYALYTAVPTPQETSVLLKVKSGPAAAFAWVTVGIMMVGWMISLWVMPEETTAAMQKYQRQHLVATHPTAIPFLEATKMNKAQVALAKIEEMKNQVKNLVAEMTKLADEAQVSFSFEPTDHWRSHLDYLPTRQIPASVLEPWQKLTEKERRTLGLPVTEKDMRARFNGEGFDDSDDYYGKREGWVSSSDRC